MEWSLQVSLWNSHIMKLRKGEKLISFACRHPNASMKHTAGRTRQEAFCPHCQFEYNQEGCIFTPAHSGAAFGKNASAKPTRREYVPRRNHNTDRRTGGKWRTEDILERIIEYHQRHRAWPLNTTAFRDSQSLPHSSTINRHFPGGITQAVAEAQELLEKELNGNGKVTM